MPGSLSARAWAAALYRLCFHSPHWRIGWRFVTGTDVWDRQDLGGAPWQVLRNPPDRFFADPFPVIWQGRQVLLFEDYHHHRGKGIISAVAFGASGPEGPAFPVLDEPWHLSYPFTIEDEGELWLLPESTENKVVSIYRSVRFPERWEKEADLLTDIEASDPTVIFHQGRFWLFASVRRETDSFSEALCIFVAERLLGPWRPHPCNPVVVDLASARPAGNIVVRNGRLWRPVQDCRKWYGAAIGLAEVLRLDEGGYQQRVSTILRPGRFWPGRRLHTLNRAGRLECIDGSALALRRDPWRSLTGLLRSQGTDAR